MKEIKVESEILNESCVAKDEKKGIRIIGGWLEPHLALRFAKQLLDALMEI